MAAGLLKNFKYSQVGHAGVPPKFPVTDSNAFLRQNFQNILNLQILKYAVI